MSEVEQVGNLMPAAQARETIMEMERALQAVPAEFQQEFVNSHHFTPHIYIRTMVIPKGALFSSAIHKYEHPIALMTGRVTIFDAHGDKHERVAPWMGFTQPGTKRVVFGHEDSILVIYLPNLDNCRDIDELERRYTAATFEEYDAFAKEPH